MTEVETVIACGATGTLLGITSLRRFSRLIGLIGLIGLMGCSSEEPASQTGLRDETPIAFSSNMQEEKSVTRAGLETTGETLFTVYGYKNTGMEGTDNYTTYQTVFPGYTVNRAENSIATSTTNSNGWEYVAQEFVGQAEQTVKYWDWSAKAYRFFAVTKTYDKLDITEANGAVKVTFRINLRTADGVNAVPYYSHLWFSNNNYPDYPKYGDPVRLEFLKPVCQVRIMFVYEDPTNNNRINTPLDDISFHRSDEVTIKQNGDVTITYPLIGTGKTETVSDTNASGIDGFSRDYREDDPSTTDKNEEDHFWYTVLPSTGQGTFTLDVTVDGDPKSTVVPAEFMDWLPGYKYTYVFKIHVDGSVAIDAVQSAFTGWSIQANNYDVYNW